MSGLSYLEKLLDRVDVEWGAGKSDELVRGITLQVNTRYKGFYTGM
ncbi:hypothetical protein GI062_25410 [Salmonella enterica]|nr:hypothetical protein [Salmonella enterica]